MRRSSMKCRLKAIGGAAVDDVVAQVSLPWPPPALQPNSRLHWSKRVKPRRDFKNACWALALEAGARRWKAGLGNRGLCACMCFHPPTRVARDLDNCLAAFKAGIDGVVLACGVDDAHWQMRISFGPVVKGGAVVLTIKKAE